MKRKKPSITIKIPKINADSTTIQAKYVTTKIYTEENGHLTEFTVDGVAVGTSLILSVSDIKQFAIKRPKRAYKRK